MPEKCFYDENVKCPHAGVMFFMSPCPDCPFYKEEKDNEKE